jgi:hypothetical protein
MTANAVLAYLERPEAPARGACELAVALCPAAFIEPGLLRAVRLEALHHLGVEAEADLWFSPLVRDRTPDGISLQPSALVELRRRLQVWLADALWRERAIRAAEVILGREANELRRVAEKITWWSLSEGDAAGARIAEVLAPLLDAVRSGRAGHARWAVRTLPRLPEAAHRSAAVWQLAAHASSAEQRPIDLDVPSPALFETLDVGQVPLAELPVRRRGRSLEIGAFPAERALGIRVPDTRPWYVEVRSNSATEVVTLLPGAVRTVEVGDGDVRLRSLSGDVFRLPARRPLVYVSHAARDPEEMAIVNTIAVALESAGFESWIDRARVAPGDPWRDTSADALARAEAGVLVLTPGALESEWVRREWDTLRERYRRDPAFIIVPVLDGVKLGDLSGPGLEPSGIAEVQAVQAADPEAVAQEVVDRLAAARGTEKRPTADPFAAQLLRGSRVLLDRQALREGLRRLVQDGGILVVNGPPGSGKSFSLQLIVYTAEVSGAFSVASVNVGPLGAAGLTPAELASALAAQMGEALLTVPVAAHESAARNNQLLANWLFGLASKSTQTWWWVLDGLGGDVLPPDTRELIIALAAGVGLRSADVRLVLLDFPAPLPVFVEPYVYREEIAPIGGNEVQAFVETLEIAGRQDRDAVVVALLDGLPEGPARLAELSHRVDGLVAALEAGAA